MKLLVRLLLFAGLMLPARAQTWTPPANEPVDAPILSFMRSNAGWHATISLPEPATAIAWQLGDDGPWQDTGLLDLIDQRTRRRTPNPSFTLDPGATAATIHLRYVNAAGANLGPFEMRFEPMAELVREQRRTLEMLQGNWVSFRSFNGILLYFTTLVSYRCAIQELWIGFDVAKPDRLIALPPCDLADPVAIPSKFQPLLTAPKGTRSASVQIIYRDGSASPVQVFSR